MKRHNFLPLAFKSLSSTNEIPLEEVINKSSDDCSYCENDFGLNDGIIGEIRDSSGIKLLVINILKTYQEIQPDLFPKEKSSKRPLTNPHEGIYNNGRDNSDYNLILYEFDEIKSINNTYTVINPIGHGISGQVFLVHCNQKEFALKIIKNRKVFLNQALIELKILEMLNKEVDKYDQYHIIRTVDYFYYYEHLCIVFELLDANLYQLLLKNHLQGISLSSIRFITKQMLEAVEQFHKAKIIHCDLKPENILLKLDKNNPKGEISIKVTDFGSACSKGHTLFKYIQSRYYRAPEVIIGLPYSTEIDMWSLGCIAAELYLGGPLLPGSCEFDQLLKIKELFGEIPEHLLFEGKNLKKYYRIDSKVHKPVIKTNEEYYKDHPNDMMSKYKIPFDLKCLDDLINIKRDVIKQKDHNNSFSFNSSISSDDLCAFIHFLKGILNLDPSLRWNAKQALRHPFITKEKLDKFISFCPDEVSQFLYLSGESTQINENNNNNQRFSYNPYYSMIQNNMQFNRNYSSSTNSYSNGNNISYDNHGIQPNLQNIQMKWLKNFPYAKVDQCNIFPEQHPNNRFFNNNHKLNSTYMAESFEKINTSHDYNYFKQKQIYNIKGKNQNNNPKCYKSNSNKNNNNFLNSQKQKNYYQYNSFSQGQMNNQHNLSNCYNNNKDNKDTYFSPMSRKGHSNVNVIEYEYEGLINQDIISNNNMLGQYLQSNQSKRTRSHSDCNNCSPAKGIPEQNQHIFNANSCSSNKVTIKQEIKEEESYQNEEDQHQQTDQFPNYK